jgi:endonuclease YncB( thermonuclease family)
MRSLLLALVLILAEPASAEDVAGPVRVIDGDTVEIGGRRIHLFGIDAPEMKQTCEWPAKTYPCGEVARTGLMDLLAGAKVVCNARDEVPEGGWMGTCRADGFDVGRNMVHTGWALAIRHLGTGYEATEEKAKQAKRGLWRGTFVTPWDWRRRN